mgnify:CR=1 FL=1
MRGAGRVAAIFGPILVATGLTLMVGSDFAPFVVVEGLCLSALAGLAWRVENLRTWETSKEISDLMARGGKLRGVVLNADAKRDAPALKAKVTGWESAARAVIERRAPQFLPQWDAPIPPLTDAHIGIHMVLNEISFRMDRRIDTLKDFLIELRR